METIPKKSERPTFLTVICIISYVGLGWALIQSLFTIVAGSVMTPIQSMLQQEFEMALDEVASSDPGAANLVENIFDGLVRLFEVLSIYGALNFVFAGLALAGVILMWNLKKIGFYLYAAGKGVFIILPFMLLGGSILATIMVFSSFFGAAIFITLYAVNIKHLK